jgi:hypothetical protein
VNDWTSVEDNLPTVEDRYAVLYRPCSGIESHFHPLKRFIADYDPEEKEWFNVPGRVKYWTHFPPDPTITKAPPMTTREEELTKALEACSHALWGEGWEPQCSGATDDLLLMVETALALQSSDEESENTVLQPKHLGTVQVTVEKPVKMKPIDYGEKPSSDPCQFPSDWEIEAAWESSKIRNKILKWYLTKTGKDPSMMHLLVGEKAWKACAQWLRERMTGRKDNG